jgi:hypothetical protein
MTGHAETPTTEARGRRGTEAVMMALGPHAARHIEYESRRPGDREAYEQHNFTKVKHSVLPQHSSSFSRKIPAADPHLSQKKEEVHHEMIIDDQ